MNPLKPKSTKGGARTGAGRKAMYRETKAMKVPTDYIPVIKALIQHLNATDMIDRHYAPVESALFKHMSRQLKRQHIQFITAPFRTEEQLDLVDHIEEKGK